MFARDLVESVSLSGDRLDLSVRLNWYRSLPLSCLEQFEVRVDGRPLDPARVGIALPDIQCSLSDVVRVQDDDGPWWHVADCVRLRAGLDPAPADDPHEVQVTLASRIPYLVGPDGTAVVIRDRCSATVTT
jgi:hypothetical protein